MKKETSSAVSTLLFSAAFVLGLLIRDFTGRGLSLTLASIGIYLFVLSLNPSTRVLRVADASRDRFVALACTLTFLLSGMASNLVFPALIETNLTGGLLVFFIFLTFAVLIYAAFRILQRIFYWDKLFTNIRSVSDFSRRDKYERVTNAMILTSAFLGLDSADITNALAMGTAALTLVASKMARIFRRAEKPLALNLDDKLWERAFHVLQYRQGLAFLSVAFTSGLPFLFYSHSIDLLALDWSQVFGLLIFTAPAVAGLFLIRLPVRVNRITKSKLRRWLVPASFALPALGVVFAYYSSILLPKELKAVSGTGVGLAWLLASAPFFYGFPVFKAISCSEADDFDGFVRWCRILALAPSPIIGILIVMQPPSGAFNLSFLLLDAGLVATLTSGFYVLMSYVVAGAVLSWEKRYNMRLDDLLQQFAGPHNSFFFLAALGLGMLLPIVIWFINFRWFFTFGPSAVLIAGLWTAFVAASILSRIGATASSSVKVAAACSTGSVLFLVTFNFSIVGLDTMLRWLISQGYLVISSLVGASILGAAGSLALARMFKRLPR